MLGESGVSFRKAGCLSDCIIMGYDYLFGKQATPYNLVPKLKYTAGGLITWDLSALGMKLYEKVSGDPTAVVNKYWPNKDVCCALEINGGSHFVWQIGRKIPVLGYKIVDPWTGKSTYIGLTNYRVTGCRIFGKV